MKYVKERLDYWSETADKSDSDNPGGGWVDDMAARAKKGTPGREGRHGGDPTSKTMDNAVFYGSLPQGMDIEDEENADIRQQPLSRGNLGTGDQYTTDITTESLKRGFSTKPLANTDDNSHNAGFYDEVEVDGMEGFLERRNVMDRS